MNKLLPIIFWLGVAGFYIIAAFLIFSRLASLQFDSSYSGGI